MAAVEILSRLLDFPVFPLLLLPFFPVLLQLANRLTRCFMGMVWNQYEDQLTLASGSSRARGGTEEIELGRDSIATECVNWLFGKKHGARLYRCCAPTRCVICLCDVEDGDEIRELKCDHVFHRGCLDRWVGFGRVTCPLCREPLVAKAPTVELPCQAAEEEAALHFDMETVSAC